MSKCEKCKEKEGTECVYYSTHEGYLCKSCYGKWLKIEKTLPKPKKHKDGTYYLGSFNRHEERYLEWLKEK